MTLIEQFEYSGKVVKFWSGFDISSVFGHSKSGKDGYMIVILDVNKEKLSFQRDVKINSVLDDIQDLDFFDLLTFLENKYLMFYQSLGDKYQDLIKILKSKFSESQIW